MDWKEDDNANKSVSYIALVCFPLNQRKRNSLSTCPKCTTNTLKNFRLVNMGWWTLKKIIYNPDDEQLYFYNITTTWGNERWWVYIIKIWQLFILYFCYKWVVLRFELFVMLISEYYEKHQYFILATFDQFDFLISNPLPKFQQCFYFMHHWRSTWIIQPFRNIFIFT